MSNMDKYKEICSQVNNVIDEFGFKTDRVAATIYGIRCRVTELEVRALQIMAKRAAEKSDEDFLEFRKNVIIYSTRNTNDEGCHQMVFRADGRFNPGTTMAGYRVVSFKNDILTAGCHEIAFCEMQRMYEELCKRETA